MSRKKTLFGSIKKAYISGLKPIAANKNNLYNKKARSVIKKLSK